MLSASVGQNYTFLITGQPYIAIVDACTNYESMQLQFRQ